MAERSMQLRARIADPKSAEIIMIRGLGGAFILPFTLDDEGTPPAVWRLLGLTGHVLVLRRDARTIEVIAPRDGSLFPVGEGNQFRGESDPLVAGDVVRVRGMRATVLEVTEAGPRRVRFEFDDALESPSRFWVTDRFDGIHNAPLPEVGFGKPFDVWPMLEEVGKD